ncbi:MAG TPA: helix-turn-helix domain-containing protein, partial [Burkholderiaceae bacterium]|nr:helix-turn-helix domain-containing protein [Burkholderiaceae bacterium]
ILACDDALSPIHVVFDEPRRASTAGPRRSTAATLPRERRTARATDDAIAQALRDCDGHRGCAAALLGISERTLYRRLQQG